MPQGEMKMNEQIREKLRHHLIVSCQALEGEPLYDPDRTVMDLMAGAAVEAGASGIRANSVRDILAIKKKVQVPVIGIIKINYPDSDIYITPTMKEVDALAACHTDIIAFDLTDRIRPGNTNRDDFFREVKKKYPDQLFMADTSTVEEGIHAAEIGVDFVGTTMAGYTPYSEKVDGPDYAFIQALVTAAGGDRVIAEGKIHTPEQLKKVVDLGVFACVVGGAITRPLEITRRFMKVYE